MLDQKKKSREEHLLPFAPLRTPTWLFFTSELKLDSPHLHSQIDVPGYTYQCIVIGKSMNGRRASSFYSSDFPSCKDPRQAVVGKKTLKQKHKTINQPHKEHHAREPHLWSGNPEAKHHSHWTLWVRIQDGALDPENQRFSMSQLYYISISHIWFKVPVLEDLYQLEPLKTCSDTNTKYNRH